MGADLQDSPLSISLSTRVSMAAHGNAGQLVIGQYGIFNKATVSQMADAGNLIQLSQTGSHNNANVVQTGLGNAVWLEQSGDNNLAEIVQQGNANVANIWQVGEQRFKVHQIGDEMVVNVTQFNATK